MQLQINALAEKVAALTALQSANHDSNRKDIHRLSNGQQDLLDALTHGMDKIADKIGGEMGKIQGDVLDLRLKWSRASGYAIGLSAASAVIFQLVRAWLAHIGIK